MLLYASLQVHRLVIVDKDDRCIGVISLSDILKFLVLRPVGRYCLTLRTGYFVLMPRAYIRLCLCRYVTNW